MAAVLVHIDLDGDRPPRPHGSSLSALAAARRIASSWGAALYAAVIVHVPEEQTERAGDTEELEITLARAGADRVVVARSAAPVLPLWAAVGGAWTKVLDQLRPRLILFGADAPSAIELGPRTAARLAGRLLLRARAHGLDDVELRDRDGGYARASDGGAAVALVGGVQARVSAEPRVGVIVIDSPRAADARIELLDTSTGEVAQTTSALVTIGDDVKDDAAITRDVSRLATMLGASTLGGARGIAIAPEVCVAVGSTPHDIAGVTSLIRIATAPGKLVDGALAGTIAENLADLCRALESL